MVMAMARLHLAGMLPNLFPQGASHRGDSRANLRPKIRPAPQWRGLTFTALSNSRLSVS